MLIDEIGINNCTIQIFGTNLTYRHMKHNEKCFKLTGKTYIVFVIATKTTTIFSLHVKKILNFGNLSGIVGTFSHVSILMYPLNILLVVRYFFNCFL